ncbi:RNA-dependent RNA polymerase [Shahe narna-like virus 2]|uniref:RNA-dependent RNA polymerase n=1 Tax=Shahe narna-like virus 2 TaxID=1923430 RepID=UPI000909CB81|nr:RNA-dependent RNA polymerase [Shahe narna-like virus 2]APG77175.1 RNA-dependent RNA polymerase [Shahe narna-like virus 2]
MEGFSSSKVFTSEDIRGFPGLPQPSGHDAPVPKHVRKALRLVGRLANGLPSFNKAAGKVVWVYGETLRSFGRATLAPPPTLISYKNLEKASHLVDWYSNTIQLVDNLCIQGSYGVKFGQILSFVLPEILSKDVQSTFLGFLWALAELGEMENYCKWSTAYFWAKNLYQKELPPTPTQFEGKPFVTKYVFPGATKFAQCISQLRRDGKERFSLREGLARFGKDLYMTKNASLPVDEAFIKRNLEKHEKILTQPHEDPLTEETWKSMQKELSVLLDEILGPVPEDEDLIEHVDYYPKYDKELGAVVQLPYTYHTIGRDSYLERPAPSRLPSFGASYKSGRHMGGACGEILRDFHDIKGDLPEPQPGYLVAFAKYPGRETRHYPVYSTHDPDLYREAEKASRQRAYREHCDAFVVPLLEAFKVRTITKGDADMYHLARRWQKIIHSRVRRHPSCRLIGQPASSAYLSQIMGNSPLFGWERQKGQGFIVSGDYESATDLLHPELSRFCQQGISQRLRIPLEDQDVLLKCLTTHLLQYEKDGPMKPQIWGQLMGSPVSFPVLCLINLAATRLSYRLRLLHLKEAPHPEKYEDYPMVVNGDDILFWALDQEHYDIWKEITRQCGLKFSLGKNYTSRDVAIINSEMYLWKSTNYKSKKFRQMTGPQTLFHQVPAINSRLLAGTSRSSAGSKSQFGVANFHKYNKSFLADFLKTSGIPVTEWFDIKGKMLTNMRVHLSKVPLLENQIKECLKAHTGRLISQFSEDEDYAKWRKTLESRQEALLKQGAGDLIRSEKPSLRDQTLLDSFRTTQMRALHHFRHVHERRDKDTPLYVAQCFGGLGFIPPDDHRFTLAELVEVEVFGREPKLAQKWVTRQSPKFASPSFMAAISGEIRDLSESLEITKIKVRENGDWDYDTLRHHAQEEKFYESSLLTGFIDVDSVIVSDLQKQEAVDHNSRIKRSFGCRELTRTAEQLRQEAKDLGYLDSETRLMERDGKEYVDTILDKSIRFSDLVPDRFVVPEPKLE